MDIRSLGYRTELIFPRFDGEITEREDYWVIRTPSNPTFFWGNYLLYKQPPAEGDYARWRAAFAREIGVQPQVNHVVFGVDAIDGQPGAVQPFLDAGFTLFETVVLTASAVQPPPRLNHEVSVRRLVEDWEWQQAIENQTADRPEGHSEGAYRIFQERRFARYRKMTAAGLGYWFGAFLGETMVADLGIYRDREIGRFQTVETLLAFRRRGICGTLVYTAARCAFEEMGLRTLVMLADEHYFAAGIYESVGFQRTEVNVGLEWFQPS
ncbi:MAG TPA: hypothetical protein VFF68_05150 [Anaerolineaceae bacterium]|nr:hypothetical protein [Anaerolineaceae bacterium]